MAKKWKFSWGRVKENRDGKLHRFNFPKKPRESWWISSFEKLFPNTVTNPFSLTWSQQGDITEATFNRWKHSTYLKDTLQPKYHCFSCVLLKHSVHLSPTQLYGVFPSGSSRGCCVFLPVWVSGGHLHSLALSPFHLPKQQWPEMMYTMWNQYTYLWFPGEKIWSFQ